MEMWGHGSKHILGKGDTALLNDKGYMCCLGQFSLQLGKTQEGIKDVGAPWEFKDVIKLLNRRPKNLNIYNFNEDTKFSAAAIHVNDDRNSTPEEKIEKLRRLLKGKGYKLRVINRPK